MFEWDISALEVDVVIPTCKERGAIAEQVVEIRNTAGWPVRIYPTCIPASASVNRNVGLDWARSPVIVMLDDDITGMPVFWVRDLVGAMLANPEWLMLSPQLMAPDGRFAMMMGVGRGSAQDGLAKGWTWCDRLLTACVAIRNTPIRFHEGFEGSGWEDNDYCDLLLEQYPGGRFVVWHDIKVVHTNEQKNQTEPFQRNRALYERRRTERSMA